MTGADRTLQTRALVDDAARTLAMADVELGDPDYDAQRIERLLLAAMDLTLHALGALRGAAVSAPFISPADAGEVLALVAAARAHHPADPFGWILGYVARAAGEPAVQRGLADVGGLLALVNAAREHCPSAPLVWLAGYVSELAGREPEAGLPVARVPLVRRPGT